MLVSYEDKKSMVPHHVELNKLTIAALMRLCVAFGVDGAKATSSKEELVDIVKRCFKKWKLDEFDALEVFTDRLTVSQNKSLALFREPPPQPSNAKKSRRDQHRTTAVEYRNYMGNDHEPDTDNDNHVLVAAKTGDRWILARLDQDEELTSQSKMMALRDEDDPSVVFSSPSYNVIPLSDECDPSIARGSRVHAVFPDTTAFYPATVVFWGREAVVCFDEDDAQTRHVSRKHVIPIEGDLAMSRIPPTKENKRDINTTPSKRQRRKPPGVVETDAEMSGGGSLINAPHSSVNGGMKIFGGGAGGQRSRGGSTFTGGETYANMISKSLHNLPGQQGSFKDICNEIEQLYSSQLNWRLESDTRHTPVWQSSVRKILSAR